MLNELALRIEEYLGKGENFAVVQVIDREAPSSGKIGDKALVLETGELIGWIGGGCVQGIVIKEALAVIQSKRYRKVRISPEGGTSESANFKQYVMACHSGGTVEVLIEPVFPQPELVVIGKSNIARKLAQLAVASDFKVTVMAKDSDPQMFPGVHQLKDTVDMSHIKNFSNTCIVVTTQGEEDELSVQKALESPSEYVGFVASHKKADQVKQYLKSTKISKARIKELKSPVGLDLNAKLAGEVAISILADIIQVFRNEQKSKSVANDASKGDASDVTDEYYINPVCNVPVSKTNPKHIVEYNGEKVYFCCDGCKVSFENEPQKYMENAN